MKRTLAFLCMLLAAMMVFVSCGEDPFFHTVEFDSDGGSNVDAQTVRDGGKAEKPATPEKEGCKFVGWYDGGEVFDFDTAVTKDYRLTAKWTPAKQTYTVTFVADGASGTVPSQTVEEGGKASEPEKPAKTGYYVLQWNRADGTKFDFGRDTVTENITLTAVWNKAYTVGQAGPSGGKVFYDVDADNDSGNADKLKSSECGWRYMEVSPENVGGSAWSMNNLGSGISTTDGIGSGEANTRSMLDSVTETAYNSWSKIVKAYKVEVDGVSYTGWYLPSKAELTAALSYFDGGTVNYWTSSFNSDGTLIGYNGTSKEYRNLNPKITSCKMRLIRKF